MNKAYFTEMKFWFLFLLFFAVLRVSAQDNITLPSSDWEKVDNGDGTFTVKYKGNKYVRNVRVVVLPQTVTLSPETLTLEVGETEELTPEFYPDFENVDKRVTWESNKTSVATVDESGIVTAVSPGTATITVKTVANEKTAEITLVVTSGKFSVSGTKQVVFSPGNLQYNKTLHKFQFATKQTDYIGEDQSGNVIDLFGGGMWLDEITDEAKITNTSITPADYTFEQDGGEFKNNKTTVDGTEWFTFSKDEWNYLITNSQKAWRTLTVNGTSYNGLVILPDGCIKNVESDDWSVLEAAGAVFLPAAGYRYGTNVVYVAEGGIYWASTTDETIYTNQLVFTPEQTALDNGLNLCYAFAVRLVREVE